MSRNLRRRIARLERRSAEQSTPKVSSFFAFYGAVLQGRKEESETLWEQLPEETREIVVKALAASKPSDEIER